MEPLITVAPAPILLNNFMLKSRQKLLLSALGENFPTLSEFCNDTTRMTLPPSKPSDSNSPNSEANDEEGKWKETRPRPSAFNRRFSTDERKEFSRFKKEVHNCLRLMGEDVEEFRSELDSNEPPKMELFHKVSVMFARRWKLKDELSEVAFRGLLLILEHCLAYQVTNHDAFAHFVEVLGYHTVFFWKKSVPLLYDSDMQFGTAYRDALLLSLTIYDVNHDRNRLRELFAAVPGLRDALLAKHAKRFEEAYHHLVLRRLNSVGVSSTNQAISETSVLDLLVDQNSLDEEDGDAHKEYNNNNNNNNGSRNHETRASLSTDSSGGNSHEAETPGMVLSGGLSSGHFQERVITVSNAPPVSLRKRNDSEWEIGQGSGGLVSCCEPVMNKDPENVWLACFGPQVPLRTPSRSDTPIYEPTNSLGLPLVRKSNANVYLSMLQDPLRDEDETMQEIREQMSLFGVFRAYSRENYHLNPVVVPENDYNTFYGGISNGLLWPAFHNLPDYMVKDYDNPKLLQEHWHSYVRVNYQFAINTVRNSRPQDFIWVHDYHLLLTGSIIQSLDSNFEVGFFLHTPFQLPPDFFVKYRSIALAILCGMTRFSKVGFQTHRDRATFISLVQQYLSTSTVVHVQRTDSYRITHGGWTTSVGVFPVSIKNEEYLNLAKSDETQKQAREIRRRILGETNTQGKLFFSCERFDYTKGIKEKLLAFDKFLTDHPERLGKDVLYQVAVINRRGVDSYREYQDACLELADRINAKHRPPASHPDWKAVVFQTDGLPRNSVVACYLAMDVGVVTPIKDGMNLVAKEMLVSNPKAGLILSCGAGTEQQFSSAGFYSDTLRCYHRLENLNDCAEFASLFYDAALEPAEQASAHGQLLFDFLMANDIEKWSGAFLDYSWTHEVIEPVEVTSLAEFYSLMFQTRTVRRQIVERVVRGCPIRARFSISLKNVRASLKAACKQGNVVELRSSSLSPPPPSSSSSSTNSHHPADDTTPLARLDISDELRQIDLDISFLEFVQSDDYDNLEQFLHNLAKHHVDGPEAFFKEVAQATQLMYRGDHFRYFFSDRDGTLKDYACSYTSSIQPAYSAVIQATFANRCTQYAAILTSAPLMNYGILDMVVLPDGYFCYGASIGREWYIDATRKFKDNSIGEREMNLLEKVADAVREQLCRPEFQMFNWIGSGLQKHYGHITVAHQDCYRSVPADRSAKWIETIRALVQAVDPDNRTFLLYEGETDVRVLLRSVHGTQTTVFTKGDGIELFLREMELSLDDGNVLVCGDSDTDLPMLSKVLSLNPERTYTIWVTQSDKLKRDVETLCGRFNNANYAFVSSPGVLLSAMAQATIREIRVRPSTDRRPSFRNYPGGSVCV
ncbi:Alpha,alpha-trehalose-phosphate synthase [UDP-forming] 2 [Trichinella nelsoni]|uniref:alpha,alpha-trehalose-phosphate synthase (UDP-forming) n=1 Tax=Trichinella nelsoni TaxID=6336 RepID=A0A0V0RIV9_9BILA|nr:Alpha,alpha-trehalose-phosphate synthase [UDP-forming] 2 [Trichinella nelsoni]